MPDSLEALLDMRALAVRRFREQLAAAKPGQYPVNPAKEIDQEINRHYPDFYPKMKERDIEAAIELLKGEGYRIMRRSDKVEFLEV